MYDVFVPCATIRIPNPIHTKKQGPALYIGIEPEGITMNGKLLEWKRASPILMQLMFPDGDVPDMYQLERARRAEAEATAANG